MTSGRRTTLWGAAALGFAGALLAALVAPHAGRDSVVHWFYGGLAISHRLSMSLVWVSMGALAVAWLSLSLLDLRRAEDEPRALTRGRVVVIAVLWLAPLSVIPPLFSRDVYSYLAQGMILHLGEDPYRRAPAVLAGLGQRHLLDAVSPFWRHTTAPYGPLFLELISLINGICGRNLVVGVLLCRALDLIGLALLAVHVPRLARAQGTDGARALWLAGASPLILFGLIVPAHNDLLMAGLLAAGVAYALRGRPLIGVALCAVAGTIKLPGLVGAIFIAVCWARSEPRLRERAVILGGGVAILIAVVAIVTVASGVGIGWLSSSIFSTPAKVRLAITPATAVGDTITQIARAAGSTMSGRGLESALGVVASAVAACVGAVILWRARVQTIVWLLALTLLLAVLAGPATWPWYLTWGVVLLAACAAPQRSMVLLGVLAFAPFLVAPNGILVLPLGSSPIVLGFYVGAGLVWWRRVRSAGGGGGGGGGGASGGPGGEPVAASRDAVGVRSALIRT